MIIRHGGGGNSNLSINVVTENIESKGLVTDSYLPSEAEIGVTVTNTSGGNYDNTAYSNIKFTSSGTSTSQNWSGASTVKLSATEGYCYAYYPYSSSASSITAIPVTAGGTDYLYATRASVNDKSKTASLTMKHALSAIRFALQKGTYSGTGAVTAVSVTSSALGSSGTLNATTGAVTATNKGTAVSQTTSLTLNGNAQNVDVVMVPSGTAGTITLSVTIDGKAYSITVSSTTIAQGSCYTYTITVNAGSLALSGVNVGAWGYNSAGSPTITAAGYTVTFAGNYTDIAFINSVSGSTVTIQALHKIGYPVKAVTTSGTATLSQSVSGMVRTITLSEVVSNVTVIFNGVDNPWDSLSDGVYAIDNTGKPVEYSTASTAETGTYQGVALVINGKAIEIAKEDASESSKWAAASPLSDTEAAHFSGKYITSSTTAKADMDGSANTQRILDAGVTIATEINNFNTSNGTTSWYLPSAGQLYNIYTNVSQINTLLGMVSGSTMPTSDVYWSSSVYSEKYAWYVYFNFGSVNYSYVMNPSRVRLVRDL